MLINLREKDTEAKVFCGDSLDEALGKCQEEEYQALFMPEIAQARINARANSDIWVYWLSAVSIRATGRTKSGTPVVIYAHKENYFSNPANILEAKRKGLINYAGILPKEDFQTLLAMDGQTDKKGNRLVWIIDYNKLKTSPRGATSVDQALEHPQTIPFLGGEQIALQYLKKHKENYGHDKIIIWHTDDLHEDSLGRLLFLGDYYCGSGLSGYDDLYYNGCFVGVRDDEAAQKNKYT